MPKICTVLVFQLSRQAHHTASFGSHFGSPLAQRPNMNSGEHGLNFNAKYGNMSSVCASSWVKTITWHMAESSNDGEGVARC